MPSKRQRDERRSDGPSNGRKKWKPQQGKGQIQGQGILLTTVRRKERKAGMELIEFLDDLVPRLYPDLDLTCPAPNQMADAEDAEEEEDDDTRRNGLPTKSSVEKPSSKIETIEVTPPVARNASKEDDIDAQIQAELQELQPHGKMQKIRENRYGKDTIVKADTEQARHREKFKLIDPEVECLMFVSVAWPMDPVKLSCALLDEVAKNGQVRGKFLQRLSPIYETTRAEMEKVSTLAQSVMSKYFPKSAEPVTFKVDSRIRLHNQLSKQDLIQPIAAAVPSPHKADLISPEYLINVEILKSVIGVGILPRYEEYKRFNPHMIAQEYHEKKAAEDDGAPSRILQHTGKST